jgi:hypothetical protein
MQPLQKTLGQLERYRDVSSQIDRVSVFGSRLEFVKLHSAPGLLI